MGEKHRSLIRRLEISKRVALGFTILASIVVIVTAFQVGEVLMRTSPDIRCEIDFGLREVMVIPPFTIENPGLGFDNGNDTYWVSYHPVSNIKDLTMYVSIANVGAGVAYHLDANLTLHGLQYVDDQHNPTTIMYNGENSGKQIRPWKDEQFRFRISPLALAPQGGLTSFELKMPYSSIGAIENLPKEYTISITDVDGKELFQDHKSLIFCDVNELPHHLCHSLTLEENYAGHIGGSHTIIFLENAQVTISVI